MKTFIVYGSGGKILRTGTCQDRDFAKQSKQHEYILEGEANDSIQKIVNGKVVDKTPEEVTADNPTPPENQRPAYITNKQWQAVLDRLADLESKG